MAITRKSIHQNITLMFLKEREEQGLGNFSGVGDLVISIFLSPVQLPLAVLSKLSVSLSPSLIFLLSLILCNLLPTSVVDFSEIPFASFLFCLVFIYHFLHYCDHTLEEEILSQGSPCISPSQIHMNSENMTLCLVMSLFNCHEGS